MWELKLYFYPSAGGLKKKKKIAAGLDYRIRTWSMKYARLLQYKVRTYVRQYHVEEDALARYVTYLCGKKKKVPPHIYRFERCSLWKLITLKAAQHGELNQGLLSWIRAFVRSNKRSNSRRWHGQSRIFCCRSCGLRCTTSLSRKIWYLISNSKQSHTKIDWHPSNNVLEVLIPY